MQRILFSVSTLLFAFAVAGCGSDAKDPLFEPKPECEGAAITPLMGQHPMVISFLEIGTAEDGFDLDNDGEPDNKLAAVGSLARGAIEDSFEDFSLVIPFEFFDFPTAAADECVKFAIYLGKYTQDIDADGDDTADKRGDCNDNDPDINKDATEVPGNFKDDDCDGMADETEEVQSTDAGTVVNETPSTNTDDMDGDGVTIADGDCDDTNTAVLGDVEICGDGLDNDCDGNADFGTDADGQPACSPYDDTPDLIPLDPLAFNSDGSPVIQFTSGTVTVDDEGILVLEAGPSIFSVNIPVTDGLNLDLRISGATIFGDIQPSIVNGQLRIANGRLGGVLGADTMDKITGLDVEQIGLLPEDSLLDATFSNILGTILALPRMPDDFEYPGCQTPDIDSDQDGLEAFCDTEPFDEIQKVDVCVDGNGDVVFDEIDGNGVITKQCTEATNNKGDLKFVDGISVEINFETMPAILPMVLP
jgi:hypothetical protein